MYKNVIVPLDGSELAEQAIPHAATLARSLGVRLLLVTACDPKEGLGAAAAALHDKGATPSELVRESERIRCQEAEAYLKEVVERLSSEGVQVEVRTTVGPAVKALTDLVSETPDPFVVMTTRGRGGLKRAVLGSVTYGLLHSLEVPIHVVPSTK